MGFFKKKSISFTSSPNGGAGCCDTFGAGTGLREFEFTDNFGYKYGTQFEEFDNDFIYFGPETFEGAGTYYKDPNSDSYYNDFFYNNNIPFFGGDGTTLQPFHIKSLYDSYSELLSGTYHFPYQIWSEVRNILTNEFTEVSQYTDEIYFQINDSGTNSSYISFEPSDIQMSVANILSLNYGDFILRESEASLSLNNSIAIGATGQFLIYEKTGILETAMITGNTTQLVSGSIKILANPASATLPIRVNVKGLNTYADLTAATAAGLLSGDLFLIGTALSIVP